MLHHVFLLQLQSVCRGKENGKEKENSKGRRSIASTEEKRTVRGEEDEVENSKPRSH